MLLGNYSEKSRKSNSTNFQSSMRNRIFLCLPKKEEML